MKNISLWRTDWIAYVYDMIIEYVYDMSTVCACAHDSKTSFCHESFRLIKNFISQQCGKDLEKRKGKKRKKKERKTSYVISSPNCHQFTKINYHSLGHFYMLF